MLYFADTNILLRLFHRDHPNHAEMAEKTLRDVLANNHSLFIETTVILEFLYVSLGARYTVSRQQSVHFLLTLLLHDQIVATNKTALTEALRIFQEKELDFVDCYLFAKAKNESGQVLSFDRHFDKLSQTIRLEPHL